ncbi:Ig-like domain-containing protein [Rubrivivax gelatinosus]|uniref:Ig-like domain-containing protein n=1 Tax=Rubrivivax gelatinosus TaxID=28068 RepID=UPI003A7FA438
MALLALAACGGGSSNPKAPDNDTDGAASMTLSLSSGTVTAASPATVTARLKTAAGKSASGVVVSFSTTNGNGSLSAETALSDEDGVATVTLSPASSTTAGADTVVATAEIGDETVTASKGFSLVATNSTITSLTADSGTSSGSPVSAYGQTVLTVSLSGVGTTAPATLALTSSCVAAGKATISPASTTVTTSPVYFTYKDEGCGATLSTDTVTASISGTTVSSTLGLFIGSPTANNIVFVSASPETIYLQGSGLTTSSTVVFQVNDRSDNPLPNQSVTLSLTTFTGGLTIQGGQSAVTRTTDDDGQVSVLVNSGTVPTPVRVTAALASGVSTVSSNLAVAVGLPSQLNFSLSQDTLNIEGYNIDGTTNTYTIYAADRSANPVPAGTTISFWAEGGQVAFERTDPAQRLDRLGDGQLRVAGAASRGRPGHDRRLRGRGRVVHRPRRRQRLGQHRAVPGPGRRHEGQAVRRHVRRFVRRVRLADRRRCQRLCRPQLDLPDPATDPGRGRRLDPEPSGHL